ncbi:MAG: DUF3748 domain-containing protein [Bacteroidota bacterium]|nr:DUF3748 domain-containing protein [Bacteroidota bacterium]
MMYKEVQLTHDHSGHCTNSSHCFSPDDQWIVYDSRNDDGGIMGAGEIAMVNIRSEEITSLYKTENQTAFGPGVGAVSFSPVADRVIFIHGIRNANKEKPYSFTRRTGVAIEVSKPFVPVFMDARTIVPPFIPGALRGGTHAHCWSGDGQWLSFTYNDYLLEQLEKQGKPVRDLRTVGVMVTGHPVIVKDDGSFENNSGSCFSFLLAEVTDHPVPGSDEIEKAFDEGWIGKNGYHKGDGSMQRLAIAFQGNVRDADGAIKTEIFIADIPEDILEAAVAEPAGNDPSRRPRVPRGVKTRRISFTKRGVSPKPRHWLRSTTDGNLVGFLAADDQGLIQLFGISSLDGSIRQLTNNSFSIQGPFNFSPDDKFAAYSGDNAVWITEIDNGRTVRVSERFSDEEKPDGSIVWSNNGSMICYNRRVKAGQHKNDPAGFLQIFLINLSENT